MPPIKKIVTWILVIFFLGGWHAPVIPWPNDAGFLELVVKANVADPALASSFWERAFGPGGFFLNLQYSVWFLFKSSLGDVPPICTIT